jgi:ubiquinone/menaquinone biosynthesis C-methylase UbiE
MRLPGLTARLATLSIGLTATLVATGQTPQATAPEKTSEINKPFAKPDIKGFIKKFESEDREVYKHREAIVAALGLKRGMAVADIGAGTGLFTRLIADRVGPTGKVYAVDISPGFLKHIDARSKELGHGHVRTVLATQDSSGLPPGSVDLVFVCDAYHHFENPPKTLASIHDALRPGGELVVVDFDKAKARGTNKGFVKKHIRAEKDVFASEIRTAGFTPLPAPSGLPLEESFFFRFRKAGDATRPGGR